MKVLWELNAVLILKLISSLFAIKDRIGTMSHIWINSVDYRIVLYQCYLPDFIIVMWLWKCKYLGIKIHHFCNFHMVQNIYLTIYIYISVQKVSSHVIWKIETFIEDTLYIGQWCLSPFQSKHLGTSHSSANCHQLLHHIFLILINGLKYLAFERWF